MGHLYTHMKIFHYRDKVDSLPRQAEAILPPVHIRIKPTNVCNHNCRYCAYRMDDLQLGKDMNVRDYIPRDKMLEIIDDIIEMGVSAVTFSGGGEPFCYPYLLDAVKKLSQSPVKFAALTNGALLKDEVAGVFANHATWLRISIDGWDGPSYAEYRGVGQNEFAKVLANIRNFKKFGGSCYTGASVIVDRTNAVHVYDLIVTLRETGINSVKVSPCIVSNSGKENNEYHEPIFVAVKEQVAKARDKFATEDFEIFDSYHEQLESFEKDYTWCPYLQILPIIGADQNVYSCQDKAYNLDEGLIGSIENMRFRDFWFSDKNKFFSINPSLHCNHHCVADSKNRLLFDYLDADKGHLGFV
jgi:MoaA/NifB/PqqE/SkfB family radical SAM enzyme